MQYMQYIALVIHLNLVVCFQDLAILTQHERVYVSLTDWLDSVPFQSLQSLSSNVSLISAILNVY